VSRNSKSLRGQVDATFPQGYQNAKARTHKHRVPLWTSSDKGIQEVLLRAFPELSTNDAQRDAAARWTRVIQLYFRTGYTRKQITEEMDLTASQINNCLCRILRVGKGLRTNGKPRGGKRGRPKKPAKSSATLFLGSRR